jgi:hypothetical protein
VYPLTSHFSGPYANVGTATAHISGPYASVGTATAHFSCPYASVGTATALCKLSACLILSSYSALCCLILFCAPHAMKTVHLFGYVIPTVLGLTIIFPIIYVAITEIFKLYFIYDHIVHCVFMSITRSFGNKIAFRVRSFTNIFCLITCSQLLWLCQCKF